MSFVTYLKETREELRHVSWPTRRQIINYTTLVVLISVITAFMLGFFDTFFTYLLEEYII